MIRERASTFRYTYIACLVKRADDSNLELLTVKHCPCNTTYIPPRIINPAALERGQI
jgi:hypothetical protein